MGSLALFDTFFRGKALEHLQTLIDLALREDGEDLTSQALFPPGTTLTANIRAKQRTLVAGLPLLPHILESIQGHAHAELLVPEGELVENNSEVARIHGQASTILQAERIILNFISRLAGIANLTRSYADRIQGTGVKLLDTRKTTPGMRYPEKYAVLLGGGCNHRMNLEEMLMLKDNHIDQVGSIQTAVRVLRNHYRPCPPIEVECRSLRDVREAVGARADRIMLDNMDLSQMAEAISYTLKARLEVEVSGGVTLENISRIAALGPTYVSVGALTHSAVGADFSMGIQKS